MALKWFSRNKKKQPNTDENEPTNIPSEEETENKTIPENTNLKRKAPQPADGNLAEDDPNPEPEQKKGLFSRLKHGLTKTRKILTTDIDKLFAGKQGIDDDMLDDLEELLITSDIGVDTTMELIETIRKKAKMLSGVDELKNLLKSEVLSLIEASIDQDAIPPATKGRHYPHVIMVVGVNGVGKTTTIGKLAAKAANEGNKVLIAAADTFRAAAIEQLAIWAERAGADIVKHKENADPAAVAYDSIEAATARNMDVVFVDTAGRLHTKVNLMEELKKIKRTIANKMPGAPHEVILVLDATTGQNALTQARMFHEDLDVTGIVLTKLDGTAKGGIVIALCKSLNLPLRYIGVGEGIQDLQNFNPRQYVKALF
jgi:fused signal recognition particle receptor